MFLNDFLELLSGVKRHKHIDKSYFATCPVCHNDNMLLLNTKTRMVLSCRADCDEEVILSALGLTIHDLFFFDDSFNKLPERMLASDLMAIKFLKYPPIVDKILSKGFYVLGAAQKSGKSYFCLNLVGEVARGGKFLGYDCSQGYAAYYSLDGDGYELIQDRFNQIYGKDFAFYDNVYLSQESADINNFISEVYMLKQARADLSLIVIDLLPYIRLNSTSKLDYALDLKELSILRDLALQNNIVILATLHTTKTERENEMHQISGTVGLSGTATGSFLLKKKNNKGGILSFQSRCSEDLQIDYDFGAHTGFKFVNLGNHVPMRESSANENIKMTQAEMFLRGALGSGESVNSAVIKDLAQKFKISSRSLQYAREKIGVIVRQVGTKNDMITYWKLP